MMMLSTAEIRIRAERRLGEMIAEQKRTVGLNKGAKGSVVTGTTREPVKDTRPTLADAGIDKKLSSRAQAIARIPEPDFEATLAEHREGLKTMPGTVPGTITPLACAGGFSRDRTGD